MMRWMGALTQLMRHESVRLEAQGHQGHVQASLEVSHSGEWVPVAAVEDALDLDSALEMVSEGLDSSMDTSVLAAL